MKRRISFSVSEETYKNIRTVSESEGLDVANYCKRTVTISVKSGYRAERVPDTMNEITVNSPQY